MDEGLFVQPMNLEHYRVQFKQIRFKFYHFALFFFVCSLFDSMQFRFCFLRSPCHTLHAWMRPRLCNLPQLHDFISTEWTKALIIFYELVGQTSSQTNTPQVLSLLLFFFFFPQFFSLKNSINLIRLLSNLSSFLI